MKPNKTIALIAMIVNPCIFALFGQEELPELELVKLDRKVNSRYHDTAPVVSPDGTTLYFFIANHPENTFGKDNTQDIWFCEKDSTGSWMAAQHMPAPFNKNRFNQVMSISRDGKQLLIRGSSGKNSKGFSLINKVNGQWQDPISLEIKDYEKMNSGRFSGGFLSFDGKAILMYFNETKNAKYSDLYVSIRENGYKFSKPTPLPSNINTRLDEFGPYLTIDDKTMYFASNRPGGYGSMDIYKTDRLDDTWLKWSDPVNIGPPINTGGFDAYYSVDETGNHGFTTRTYITADGGSMDIFGLQPKKIEIVKTLVSGFVYNAKTNKLISANIKYSVNDQASVRLNVNESEGMYEFEAIESGLHRFEIVAPGYLNLNDSLEVSIAETDTMIQRNFYLTPIEVGLKVRLDKIYFDFDKTTLRNTSFEELNKVVKYLQQNPHMKIEIGGHTDNKGSDSYNLNLSQGRAEAVRNYLVSKWISKERIEAQGYGESAPETRNDTEEGRQVNRRVEFKVLEN